MKALGLLLVVCVYSFSTSCFGQVTFKGSSNNVSTGDNANTIVVDGTLEINTTNLIDGVRVYIKSNFATGDILDYSSAAKPSAISATWDQAQGILTFTGNASASVYQELLRTVTFTASAMGLGNRVIEFTLGGKTPFIVNGTYHYYEYVSNSLSWTDAKAAAAQKSYYGLKGYLATITSQGENDFIYNIIGGDSWIGASDNRDQVNAAVPNTYPNAGDPECRFYWVTGPEAGSLISTGSTNPHLEGPYMNWNHTSTNKEPTYSSGESYVLIYKQSQFAGKWNDESVGPFGYLPGYVVEYGGMSTGENVDATHTVTVEVINTELKTTQFANQYTKTVPVVVDDALELKSGSMITDARVTISSNFFRGDTLKFSLASKPAGVNGSYDPITGVLSFTGTAKPYEWQKLFRTVTFLSTSTSTSDRTITFSVGKLISGSNGHFYEFVSNYTNWTVARDAAAAKYYMGLQGYLATITSSTENKLISDKLTADGWLGGSDDVTEVENAATAAGLSYAAAEGNFYWVTGPEKGKPISIGNLSPVEPLGGAYNNWKEGEPNNSGGENYLKMYTVPGAEGTWNDMPITSSLPMGMVVEYGGLPTDPGVILSANRILTMANVLPVRGLSFHVKEKENNVVLNWSVLMEDNVKRYDVLSSMNGSNFRKIGEVKALDRTNQTTYSYTDQNPVNGCNYYKIVVVDEDGQLHYSDIRSITIQEKIQVYPTIINDHFTVQQPNPSSYLLTVTNVSGHKLLQKTITQGINQIETGLLTRGTYFVQIYTGAQEPKVFKIIKK